MADISIYQLYAERNIAKKKSPPADLRGQRYGRLVVVDLDLEKSHRIVHWLCKCDCGGTRIVSSSSLRHDLGRKNCGDPFKHNPKHDKDRIRTRFMRRVSVGALGECWLWTGRFGTHGYGEFDVDTRRPSRAHRVSYELHVGPIPEGKMLLHSCDNRKCVNPDHLRPGNAKENSNDMMVRATRHYKLTQETVAAIKADLAADGTKGVGVRLATKYGVTRSLISMIKLGKIWDFVPWPEGCQVRA